VSTHGIQCPECGASNVVMNGRTRHGKQCWRCRMCGRQFVQDPQGRIRQEIRRVVDQLIGRRLPAQEIAEIAGVSRSWVYSRMQDTAEADERRA